MLITRKTMVSWQAFPSLLPRAPLAFLSRLKLPFPKLPFPSLSNACHAGYFFNFDRNFLIIVICLHDDVTRIAMATWLTHQMLGLSKFSIIAKFQESRTGGSQARFTYTTKMTFPASANEANSFMFCGMCLFRSSQYIFFFINLEV